MVTLQPQEIEQALTTVLQHDVACVRVGEAHQVDTPYVLQDGRLLRVFFRPGPNGSLTATDGSYAAAQIETFARSSAALRERYANLQRIAAELDLEWDGEFRFTAPDLASTVQRLAVLSRAVDRALSLLVARPHAACGGFRERVLATLRAAQLEVVPRVRIGGGPEHEGALVAFHVRGPRREGAVELLGGRTKSGATIAVDRAVTTFHLLERLHYAGELVAVYDVSSLVAAPPLQRRFRAASPSRAHLLPAPDLVPALHELLAGRLNSPG